MLGEANLNTICVIPARSGSKGIRDKNILNLRGHPLLAWSIEVAKKSNLIERTIVSTDSEEYKEIALSYGAEVPFLRPKELSQDNSTDLEFMKHLLMYLEENENLPKIIVHLRPTTPVRDYKIVDKAILNFDSNKFTSLRSVHKISTPVEKIFKLNENQTLSSLNDDFEIDKFNDPRQSFENAYEANGYVDILKTDFILNNNLLHGNNCQAFLTARTYDIDEKEDYEDLEYILTRKEITLERLLS